MTEEIYGTGGLGAAEASSKPHPDACFETLDPLTGAYERVENGGVVEGWRGPGLMADEVFAAADAHVASVLNSGFAPNYVGAELEANVVAEDLVRINDSGIIPTEFKVLVLPDESETQIKARRSNIMVPDAYAAMYAHGSVTGTIIAMSPAAFSYHDWPAGCRIPLVGERIVFARYAGMLVQGKSVRNERGHDEAREYRLLNDKDVVAVLEF